MRYQRYFLYVLATVFLAGIVFWSFTNTVNTKLLQTTNGPLAATSTSTSPTSETSRNTSASSTGDSVLLTIEGKNYQVKVQKESTVLGAMNAAKADGFSFTGREYPSLGFFVESINGKKSGDGYYWFLYLNGKSSEKGASQMTLDAGDSIEWRYEKSH